MLRPMAKGKRKPQVPALGWLTLTVNLTLILTLNANLILTLILNFTLPLPQDAKSLPKLSACTANPVLARAMARAVLALAPALAPALALALTDSACHR